MSKDKIAYKKQYGDLRYKYENKEMLGDELIELIIKARRQRDGYKEKLKLSKKTNNKLSNKLQQVYSHVNKIKKCIDKQ